MKKFLALVLTFVLIGTIAGCSDNKSSGGDSALSGWEYVEDKGELIVGLDDTFAPMGFRDESDNLVGFDIDLATKVGEKLGVNIKFQPIDWNSKELELSSKRIDCIWNGMSATKSRQKEMSLTKKYLNNRIVIMTIDGGKAVTSKDDLKEMKIGTQEGSSALETMMKDEDYDSFKDNISEFPTYDEVILDMQAGRLDCMVVDEVLGEYKNSKLTEKFIVSDINFGDDFYAIGCRKGETDLADKINEAIAILIEEKTAEEISNKWFDKNIVILEGYDE